MSKFAVLDLEMCDVPKGEKRKSFGYSHEIIQIGAVLIDDDYNICDSFMSFVKPEFGSLTPFIRRLTGISDKDLENAPESFEALSAFTDWLPDDAYIVCWSGSDELQLSREMEGKGICLPKLSDLLYDWIDCQEMFSEKLNNYRQYSLSEAINMAGFVYEDDAHDALVDALNTAKLFIKLDSDPDFSLSPYLYGENNSESFAFRPFSSLLSMLDPLPA